MSYTRSEAHTLSDHESAVEIEGIEIFESESQADTLVTGHYQPVNNPLVGLSIKEACAFYKTSESTIRGRLKRNELAATKVRTPSGEQWRIFPDGSLPGHYQPVNRLVTTPSAPSHDNALIDLLDRKTERLEAAMLEIGSLKAQLQASQEKTKLLEDRSKVSWWRRFLNYLKQ
jgi:hypothetical protein